VFGTPLTAARRLPLAVAAAERGDVVLIKAKGGSRDSPFFDRLDAVVSFFTLGHYSAANPAGLTSHSPTLSRIAALPGDRIYLRNSILYVRPPDSPSYLTEFELSTHHYNITTKPFPSGWQGDIGIPGDFPEVTLGPDEFYLLSDDRSSSFDSRLWGPIPGSDIIGKVWLRYFPLRRFALF
jgi:signal peptidase I